jgi:hypothetical protein
MRKGVSGVFVNLARRTQVLLHRQLTLLDAMERRTPAGEELADLFRLDHMTTRMRRHAEGLVILSGAAPSRQWRKPIPLIDVTRAAVAEVENFERVEVRRLPRLSVAGSAVADVTHLLAELVENATVFSPPNTTVHIHGQLVANGFALEIDDRGLGMAPDALLDANLRLGGAPEFELSDTARLGLFVVSRLAQRQGIRVSLRHSPYGGITAVVLIPSALLTEGGADEPPGTSEQSVPGTLARRTADRSSADGDDSEPGTDEMRMMPGDVADEAEIDPDDAFRARGVPLSLPNSDTQPEPQPGPAPRPGPFDFAEQHQQAPDAASADVVPPDAGPPEPTPGGRLAPLPRRRPGSRVLVAGGGRALDAGTARQHRTAAETDGAAGVSGSEQASAGLPRRVRQASLAPQSHGDGSSHGPGRQRPSAAPAVPDPDADEVRARMASLQRGWQRGRSETDDTRTADRPDNGPSEQTHGTTSEGDAR